MRITVCITNHNYADFVALAVESALGQDHPDVDVVVVDDGSTDESLEILAPYGDRVRLIRKANGGQASAINEGFLASRGEGILFLDADDVLLPGALRRISERFEAGPTTAKVSLRMRKIDRAGVPTGELEPARGWKLPVGDLREHVLRRRSYVWPASSGNAYRRSVLEELLPMPEEPFRVEADLYLVTLAPLCGPIDAVDQPLVGYRIHGGNRYAGVAPDASFFRDKLSRIECIHHVVRARAGDVEVPRTPADVADPAYTGYRLASAVLDPAGHPHREDSWRKLAVRGARLALRHPGHRLRARLQRCVWFSTVAIASRPWARWLVRKRYS